MEQARSQNAYTPVFKLTDKLLLSIIHLLNPAWVSSERHPHHASHWVATVRAISQVCFRWRIVSISDSSLWNFFDLKKGTFKWIEELCRRSADAPFLDMVDDTHRDDYDGRLDQIIAIVPNILPRIRFLHARISVDAWVRILESCAQLEDLKLIDFDQYSLLPATPESPPRILLCQFNRNPPPLRKVSMHYCDVDLCSPFFSNVSDLKLCSDESSISQLASIIKNMPHLERLSLSLEDAPFFPNETNLPLITIPRLRSFHFDNLELLKCFQLSQDCVLHHFGIYAGTSTKLIIDRFIWAHIADRNPYLHISVHAHGFPRLIIDNRRSMCESSEHLGDYDLLHLSFPSSESPPAWVSVLEELMSGISKILPTIVFLKLDVQFNTDWEDVVPYLHQCARLESLYMINRNKNPNLLRSLQIFLNTGTGNTILFPSLRNFVQTHLTKPLQDQLESYLAWRLDQGAAIEHLEIQNPKSITRMGQDYVQELAGKYGLKIKAVQN